jgi:hypothetical protein
MLPDYPHKIFADKRLFYCMLMETLSMEEPVFFQKLMLQGESS